MPRYQVWTSKVVHERHIVEAACEDAVYEMDDYGPVLETEEDYRDTLVEEIGDDDA